MFNVIFLSVALAVARQASALKSDVDNYDCSGKSDGNYVHPSDCGQFITCHNGRAAERDCAQCHVHAVNCPNGKLHFNGEYCDWADLAGCKLGPTNDCQKKTSPTECVQDSSCAYCLDETVEFKCDTIANSGLNCRNEYTEDPPKNTTVTPEDNPNILLPLFVKRSKNFTVTFQVANSPIDFYLLMDFSGSFYDDKITMVELSPSLISTVASLSSDYRIGFGSFVDKPVGWFGHLPDYSYWNRYPLHSDASSLTEIIQSTPVLGGGDGEESQLDGIAQVAVCTTEIGWRNNSRRVLLMTTDYDFHRAGDGEMFNLTNPFDGECHLNDEGYYSEETTMDYPSEEQLIKLVDDNGITVIFAVTAGNEVLYSDLANRMKSAKTATLQRDSSNILELLKEVYSDIKSHIRLEATELTDDLSVTYFSNCDGDIEMETSSCTIPYSGSVTFKIEVSLNECPADPADRKQKLIINPVGLPSHIVVDISCLCD